MIRSLVIKGRFTDFDLAALMAAVRTIERRQPDETFLVTILETDRSTSNTEAVLRQTFPRIEGDEPTIHTYTRLMVLCPDGVLRDMIPDIIGLVPDIDQPTLLMMQGTVEIDGQDIKGEAWLKNGRYHFTPF
jgi:hypothetical protein